MLYPSTFSTFSLTVSPSIQISGIHSPPTGPPLLLLHGFPQTHIIWHKVAPSLSTSYTLVIPDLRGYGASSKPPSDPAHANYSKSAMAGDMVALMAQLGHPHFYVCGHDRGGRVAHSMMVRHPDAVRKGMLLDISPTATMFAATDQAFATAYFHWFFLIQPAPFPEEVIGAAPRRFLEYAMKRRHLDSKFHPEAWEEYVRAFEDGENVRAACEDYRAAATVDLEEQREEREKGMKIRCGLRVLWGKQGVVEKMFDCVADWKKLSDAEVTGEALDCGHYIPEEKPDDVVRHVKEFFVE